MSGAKLKAKSIASAKPRGAKKSRQEKVSTVEVASEVDDQGAPPDFIDPDPELSPEEAEQARKRYLLRLAQRARLLGPQRR